MVLYYISMKCPYNCQDTKKCKKGITAPVPCSSVQMIPTDIANHIIERLASHIMGVHVPPDAEDGWQTAMDQATEVYNNAEVWDWDAHVTPANNDTTASLRGRDSVGVVCLRSRSPLSRRTLTSEPASSSSQQPDPIQTMFSLAGLRHLSTALLTELVREASAEIRRRD